jgi:hypothetical protein
MKLNIRSIGVEGEIQMKSYDMVMQRTGNAFSILLDAGGSSPDDELLLFRQKDPKPVTPRLALLKRRDANFLKSGPTRRAQTRAAGREERPSGSQPAGVGSHPRKLQEPIKE